MGRNVLILCLAVWFLGAGVSRAAETGYTFFSDDWEGGAFTDDETGEFSYCTIYGEYESGITLYFGIEGDYELFLALSKPAWNIEVDSEFEVSLMVDGRPQGMFAASAVDPTIIRIEVGDDGDVFESLRRGNLLEVVAALQTFEFELVGTFKGLEKLLDCYKIASTFSHGPDNPFASPSNPFASGDDSDDDSDEDFVVSLLRAAGLEDFDIVPPEDRPELDDMLVVWGGEDFLGFTFVDDTEGWDPSDHFFSVLGDLGADCMGEFATGSHPGSSSGQYFLKDGFGICRETSGTVSYNLLGVFHDGGVMYFSHIAEGAGRDIALETTTNLVEVLSEFLRDE